MFDFWLSCLTKDWQGIHPLLLQETSPKALGPGLLKNETFGHVSDVICCCNMLCLTFGCRV
jgi:hypothetical protein